jgi:caffeoyl-CoA O-methyltransferase
MNTNSKLLLTALAFGLSAGMALAQERGGPPRGGGREGMRFPMPPYVQALDANSDGVIDAIELTNASAALKKLDRNGDGRLTQEEYGFGRMAGPGFGGPGGPAMGGPPEGGPGASGGRGQREAGGGSTISFESATLPRNDTEKKILAVLDDMNQNQRRGSMSVPTHDGRILRVLAESLGAKHIVEIGTSIGYSGTWFCLGLQQTGGKLTTFEIDAGRAATARANFKRAGVDSLVTLVEGDAHENVAKLEGPIDILFLDADKEGYLDYLNKLLPKLRPGGLVIAHNMNQRQADSRFVEAIKSNPELETVFMNLETSGISVSLKKR